MLLLREFDHGFRLTEDLAGAYVDPRRADRIEQSILALLRTDPVLQTVVGQRDLIDGLLPELERLVPRLRAHSLRAPLALRADAGFATPRLHDWLEDHGLSYAIGFGSNVRLKQLGASLVERARQPFERTQKDVRLFSQPALSRPALAPPPPGADQGRGFGPGNQRPLRRHRPARQDRRRTP